MKRIVAMLLIISAFALSACQIGSAMIYFESNGAGEIDFIARDPGAKLTGLPTPSRYAYDFDCWCYDEELKNRVTPEDLAKRGETTLYARYELNEQFFTPKSIIELNDGASSDEREAKISTMNYFILKTDKTAETKITVTAEGFPIKNIVVFDENGREVKGTFNVNEWTIDSLKAGDYLMRIDSTYGNAILKVEQK